MAAFAGAANGTSFRDVTAGAWADASSAALSIASGLAGVLAIILWQSARERRDKVSRMHRSATALEIELGLVAEVLYDTGWHRVAIGSRYEYRSMPRSVYDALGYSGVLANLDAKTQELLYRFYWNASLGKHEAMGNAIEEVVSAVNKVKRSNAPGFRSWAKRIFRIAPEDGTAGEEGRISDSLRNGRGGAGTEVVGDGSTLSGRGSRPI